MAITPPTRTAGSLGTTKSNAQPVTNEPQQLSAPQYNVCADNLIAVINQSNANEAAIAGAGGGIANYGTWDYDPTTSAAGIAAGEIRFSGANPTTSGIMYIHKTNLQGFDMSGVLSELRSWRMSFISTDGTELLTVFVSNIFDTGAHYTFQITQQAGSAALTNDFVFTVSPIAPAAFEIPQGGTYALGNWFWTGSTTLADPGSGNINMSTSSPGSATALYVNVANASNGVDFIEVFQDLQVGDFILLRENDDGYGVRYVIDAPPIDNGTWFNIPVAAQSQGGGIGSSATMRMVIIKSTAAAAALQGTLLEFFGDGATGTINCDLSSLGPDLDLYINVKMRKTDATNAHVRLRFNGDATAGAYTSIDDREEATGNAASPSYIGGSQTYIGINSCPDTDATAGQFLQGELVILDYDDANTCKMVRGHAGVLRTTTVSDKYSDNIIGAYNTNQGALTSLEFTLSAAGNFTTDSVVRIWAVPLGKR